MLRINQEEDKIALNFKIIMMVVTIIFVMGGAVHLSGSDAPKGYSKAENVPASAAKT